MPANVQVKFGLYDFGDDIEEIEIVLDSRVTSQIVPKRHGVLVDSVPVLDARLIRVRGTLNASSVDAARQKIIDINQAINAGRQKFFIWDDMFTYAYKKEFNYMPIPGAGFRAFSYTIGFVCDDPFSYKTDIETTMFLTCTSPPINFTVNNIGTAFVFPRIQFIADMGSQLSVYTKITNHIIMPSGTPVDKYFQYNGTVDVGKVLDVDCNFFTIKNDGVGDLQNFATGSTFIWLNQGINNLTYDGAPCTLAITNGERYAI